MMASGKETFYDGEISLEKISRIYSQLKLTELFLIPGMKRTANVDVESFEFVCPRKEEAGKSWFIDIPYSIVIGNRRYDKWLSDWSNDLDRIRHDLENYVFHKECKFVLDFDTEETIIELSRYNTLEYTEHVGGGTAYHYKDFMKVVVRLGYHSDGAPILGICDQQQVIRQFYEGFLNVARSGYQYDKGKYENAWECSPLTFYNRIKSPIIEDYLTGRKYDEDELQIRQRVIRHAFTICPDYGDVLFDDENRMCYGCESLEADEVLNLHIDRTLVSDFYKWQSEFESKTDGVNSTMGTLDSKEWNKRGLELAQRLRQQLPDEFDLWYAYPFEDEENRGKRPILIYKDYAAIKAQKEKQKTVAFNKMALLAKAINKVSDSNKEKTDDERK